MPTTNTFFTSIMQSLATIAPSIDMVCENIADIPEREAQQVLRKLVQYACQSQHNGNISAARDILSELPSSWLAVCLPDAVEATLTHDDEWEFRRLIELLRTIAPEFLERYLAEGQRSSNIEVREAAEELRYLARDAESKYFLFKLFSTCHYEQGLGLLPGIPQSVVRNRAPGLIRPGMVLEIACIDGASREFTLETFCVSVLASDLEAGEQKRLPLIPVIRCDRPELLQIGGDVAMKIK